MNWAAIERARAHEPLARRPVRLNGRPLGSVALAHLPALRRWFDVDTDTLELRGDADTLSALLEAVNRALHEQGLIRGWRDERIALLDPASGRRCAAMERAAARFWGTLTLGAHANGFVADAAGQPTHVWIAQRALNKSTDPGLFDNLIGGGVPDGQTPAQTLQREGWEEAGLRPPLLAAARPGRVIELRRDIAEGLQHEWLHVYDLPLPANVQPLNQDGEVAGFELLPLAQAIERAAGAHMTVDASLVTLDFVLRHRLLPEATCATLAGRSAGLWVGGVQ